MSNNILGVNEARRLEFDDIEPGEVIFDVGGNRGEFTADMVARYGVVSHIFEPIPELADIIAVRFAGTPGVEVHAVALSDKAAYGTMHYGGKRGVASGAWYAEGELVNVGYMAASTFIAEHDEIAVLKLNCEGGEYAVLSDLIDTGDIVKCRHVQVQFHDIGEHSLVSAAALRERLKATHEQQWCTGMWDFEGWVRRA